jgi:hypothetical protein
MRLVLTLATIHVAEFKITVWPGMIKSDDGKYSFPLLKEDDYKNITRQRNNCGGDVHSGRFILNFSRKTMKRIRDGKKHYIKVHSGN